MKKKHRISLYALEHNRLYAFYNVCIVSYIYIYIVVNDYIESIEHKPITMGDNQPMCQLFRVFFVDNHGLRTVLKAEVVVPLHVLSNCTVPR